MVSNIARGKSSEDLVCDYLKAQGLELLVRNFQCRMGELDLIMRDGDYLVFVEVRSRKNSRYGSPAETVTRYKQKRLIRAANFYLQRQKRDWPCRFDVVAVIPSQSAPQVDWIKNAFQAF